MKGEIRKYIYRASIPGMEEIEFEAPGMDRKIIRWALRNVMGVSRLPEGTKIRNNHNVDIEYTYS